jgi:hypothetical protein
MYYFLQIYKKLDKNTAAREMWAAVVIYSSVEVQPRPNRVLFSVFIQLLQQHVPAG